VLAEDASREWGLTHDAHPKFPAGGDNVQLQVPLAQTPLLLHAGYGVDGMAVANLFRRRLTQSQVADLACFDEFLEFRPAVQVRVGVDSVEVLQVYL